MERIKFASVDGTLSFDFPWEWCETKNLKPRKNDLEATAKRGKLNGTLYRKRQAQIPGFILPISTNVYRYEVKALLKIIKQEKYKATYFNHWTDEFVTSEFYTPPMDLPIKELPENNNTDNILYAPFDIEMIGYSDVS